MWDSAIDNMGFGHAAAQCLHAGFNFREHARADRAALDHLVDLLNGQMADAGFGVFDIGADAMGIRDDDELFSLHRSRDGAGGGIRIDIQFLARIVRAMVAMHGIESACTSN